MKRNKKRTVRTGGPKGSSFRALGIRGKLTLYFVSFVTAVLAILWIFQIGLLGSFYRLIKSVQLTRAADRIVSETTLSGMDTAAELMAVRNELCVIVLDEQCTPVISYEGTSNCLIHKQSSQELRWWCGQAPEDGSSIQRLFRVSPRSGSKLPSRIERSTEATVSDLPAAGAVVLPDDPLSAGPGLMPGSPADVPGNAGTEADTEKGSAREWNNSSRRANRTPGFDNAEWRSLLSVQRITMADGTNGYLMLNMSITPVDATVSTLRTQLIFITIIVLIAAYLLARILSRRFSRPIIETNTASRALARARYDRPQHADSYREIAELNDTLERTAVELNQVENLQHELVANISHDLRTPLTMIGGYSELMRDIPSERSPGNMQIIIDETNRLSSLVSELLDFSRLEAGIVQMDRRPFNVTAAVRAIAARNDALFKPKGYTISFTASGDETVCADEKRIEQVVYNLMNNALTYTGEDKTVRISQTVTAGRVRISVRDSGKGIPADELPLIWNRYYRAKENHKRAIQGSGLGLSIVHGILESHQVPYGVDSSDGEGTCFWFELDRCRSDSTGER